MAQRPPSRAQRAAQQSTLEGWLSTQLAPNTRAAYRSDLVTFDKWCAGHGAIPLLADTATLVTFQAARQAAGDSDATLRRRWSALSSFYEFAIDHELRSINPAVGVDRPKISPDGSSPTALLSEATVARCRNNAAALDPRLEALVALLVIDGLKVTEALALDVSDLSGRSSATTLTVRRRGELTRVVLDPDSARAVRRCVAQRRSGAVFVSGRAAKSHDLHRLTRFGADHLIRRLRTDDMAEHVTANALRRYYIETRH
jgi:integrase/recombinase XerD